MSQKNNCGLIVCWFGHLPDYKDIWLKSCESNTDFNFLLFTDNREVNNLPSNVHHYFFTMENFLERVKKFIITDPSITRSYRVCDFRPMYGVIFENELKAYDFWGYCDVDVVFGNLKSFITTELLSNTDAIFNGGHLSVLRNCDRMNQLYKEDGALFDYQIVTTKDAIFAFDEITGIQNIARNSNLQATYLIPYIDTEIRFRQLRSRLDKINPNTQAYYWEKGYLFRVKVDENQVFYQEQAYIHLQKREIQIISKLGEIDDSFWITPNGFEKKTYYGKPKVEDIIAMNPFLGKNEMKKENMKYNINKIFNILSRKPYQIYVRIIQQRSGINRYQGSIEERIWKRY
ncbi:MAG: DUF6625 family protein [Velocimicrobium sp.]